MQIHDSTIATRSEKPVSPELQKMRVEEMNAQDNWGLFADLLEYAAKLARLTEKSIAHNGGFDHSPAQSAIVLALEAVEPWRVQDLRGDPSKDAYAVDPVQAAEEEAKRLFHSKTAEREAKRQRSRTKLKREIGRVQRDVAALRRQNARQALSSLVRRKVANKAA